MSPCCADLLIERLHFEPGDVALIHVERELTPASTNDLRDRIRAALPDGVKGVLAQEGLTIEVIARAVLEEAVRNE